MKYPACVLVLILLSVPAEASIVVILASRTGIIVAADSRRTTDGVVFHDACKIKAGTRGVFAATGTYPNHLLKTVWNTGQRLVNGTATAEASLDILIEMLQAERVPPDAVHNGGFAFAFWTSTGPTSASARFTTKNGRYSFERKIDDWQGDVNFGAGYVALSNVPPLLTERDLLSFARQPESFDVVERVVKLQASRDATVGGPTDLLRIDAQGVHWHRQKPTCRKVN